MILNVTLHPNKTFLLKLLATFPALTSTPERTSFSIMNKLNKIFTKLVRPSIFKYALQVFLALMCVHE